jgi:hypothetical protein
MRVSECGREMILSYTVDVTRPEERKKLDTLGNAIATQKGLRYEGYNVSTVEPYTLEKAKAVLYFN